MGHDKHWATVCMHVYDRVRPVKLITHERDGTWQILCGEYDHDDTNGMIICSACAFDHFPELTAHQALPKGHLAEDVDGQWSIALFDT